MDTAGMHLDRLGQWVLFEIAALPYALMTAQPRWRKHGALLAGLAGLESGDRVLDLGCGPGESAFGMAERVPGLRVVGLDSSPAMIRIARARRHLDPVGPMVDLARGDAVDLPFPDGGFDAVTGHSFLYLVSDAERVLREAKRVLAPGRRCVFLEPATGDGGPLLPGAIRARALREPRFVSSMVFWRLASRRYGRFDEPRFRTLFEAAGLDTVEVRPTLEGLGTFGVARRPPIRSLADVDWTRWTPADRATLLFVVDEAARRVLLIEKKRGLGAGKVNGPGGRIEKGEDALACAVREVEEELRVTPTGVREMGELSFQFADGYALHGRVFRADGILGVPTETEEATPLWTPLDHIPYARMWADDALWLPMLLRGERFAGRFVFDGDAMLDHTLGARGQRGAKTSS
jgi:8-oxo-dGTP diphosphatase